VPDWRLRIQETQVSVTLWSQWLARMILRLLLLCITLRYVLCRLISIHSPKGGAVEVDHHLLGRVERERRSVLHAVHEDAILGTDESHSRVRRFNVYPDSLLVTYDNRHSQQQRLLLILTTDGVMAYSHLRRDSTQLLSWVESHRRRRCELAIKNKISTVKTGVDVKLWRWAAVCSAGRSIETMCF